MSARKKSAIAEPQKYRVIEHTHVHDWEGGARNFTHLHPMPQTELDVYATRKHKHKNGWHSHPHDHTKYQR